MSAKTPTNAKKPAAKKPLAKKKTVNAAKKAASRVKELDTLELFVQTYARF